MQGGVNMLVAALYKLCRTFHCRVSTPYIHKRLFSVFILSTFMLSGSAQAILCGGVNCDDGNPCTTDECVLNLCVHVNLSGLLGGLTCCNGVNCDDNNFCTQDTCVANLCVHNQ